MKTTRYLLSLCLAASLSVTAARADESFDTKFGKHYDEVATSIKAALGTPASESADSLVYRNISYRGFQWSEVLFCFQDGVLIETRCYKAQASKGKAVGFLPVIAREMEKNYVMTHDYEEDGTVFYAGGISPKGFGHLFTIYASPGRGGWSSQLRFGPFRY